MLEVIRSSIIYRDKLFVDMYIISSPVGKFLALPVYMIIHNMI